MVSGIWNGVTSTADEQTIKQNLGNTCLKTYSIY